MKPLALIVLVIVFAACNNAKEPASQSPDTSASSSADSIMRAVDSTKRADSLAKLTDTTRVKDTIKK